MTLYHMFDAAYPPQQAPPFMRAVAGYIGGNTPHVWTSDEWRRFAGLAQFPIWVGYQQADPAEHGSQAAAAMHALGWAAGRPSRRAVILDEETEVDPAWLDAFANVIWAAGYETLVYGSASTIIGNPPKEGRFIALYNGIPNIPGTQDAIGHQYKANVAWDGTQIDLSVITAEMLAHAGVGARK